jgi:hypothetical protein
MSDVKNLMIKCPTTGRNADTGFSMTPKEFKAAPLSGKAFECGQCLQMHAWAKADVINAG